jgi:hypothetical protein
MPGPRAKKECKCPGFAGGGGRAMPEFTDALSSRIGVLLLIFFNMLRNLGYINRR